MTDPHFATRRSLLTAAAASLATLAIPGATMASQDDTNQQRAHNVEVARKFLDLLHRKEIDAWGELWAENGRIIVFYPPEGFGSSIDGKAEILKAFRGLFGNFESFETEITGIYPAADSDAVVVEYRPRAVIKGGTVYTNSNIAIFRFENGLISVYHDYFDPRRFQLVVDALSKK